MDINTTEQALKLQTVLAGRLQQTLELPQRGKPPTLDALVKEKEQLIVRTRRCGRCRQGARRSGATLGCAPCPAPSQTRAAGTGDARLAAARCESGETAPQGQRP